MQFLALVAAASLSVAPIVSEAGPSPIELPATCASVAQSLADESETTDGYDFACLSTGEVVVDVGTETLSAEMPAAAADDFCRWDQQPVRTIVSQTSETLQFCILYGQTDHPVNGSWVETISSRATVNLQYLSHNVAIRTLGEGSTTAVWSGTVTFERHLTPLNYQFEDATTFRIEDTWTPRLAANTWVGDYEGQWTGGVSSMIISLENMQVSQPSRAFSISIPNEVTTHRFQCEWANDRCVWPGGQEASFSGSAGR